MTVDPHPALPRDPGGPQAPPADHEGYWFPRDRPWMGTADWRWEPALSLHMPCCRMGDGYGQTCGNGPLTGDQIERGNCDQHGITRS